MKLHNVFMLNESIFLSDIIAPSDNFEMKYLAIEKKKLNFENDRDGYEL